MKAALEELNTAPFAVLTAQSLDELLENGDVLQEENTHISDMIRIVSWHGTILVQEKTNRDEFLIRKMSSQTEAEEFLQKRLKTYDRMWDG